MKAKVDLGLCISCGLCIEGCPEVFRWDNKGLAEAYVSTVPPDSEDAARQAAEDCPTDAIAIEQ